MFYFRVLWKAEKDQVYFRLQAKTKESDFAALGFVDPSSNIGKKSLIFWNKEILLRTYDYIIVLLNG